MCEWRVFFQVQPAAGARAAAEDTNLSAIKTLFPGLERGSVEERTDLYFPYSAAVGVKARGIGLERPHGEDTVEVKLRTATEEGGYETWVKHRWNWDSVKAKLKKRDLPPDPGLPQLGDLECRVQKRRRSTRMDGLKIEFTEVRVVFDASIGRSDEEWVSVCVEGSGKGIRAMSSTVLPQCKAVAHEGTVSVMGYPEFVLQRASAAP